MKINNSIPYILPAVLLVAAGYSARSLRGMRDADVKDPGLAMRNGASVPMIEFVNVALGGFRGLAADLLWLRASRLQEERRFVELAQLSDWITKLEPRLAEVWVYHAWNMAYNISVLTARGEDRWLWIQNGVELLRDGALPLNPRNATIQRELGWIFQHKISSDSDRRFAAFYRSRWASEIAPYLAPGGAIPEDDDYASDELRERFRMEPALMREIEARFGRIDWRLPTAQSLYWAWRGLDTATAPERLPCRRMIYTTLGDMAFGSGILVGDPSQEDYRFAAKPNPVLIIPTAAFYEETMQAHDFVGIRTSYIGFMTDGMRYLHAVGDERNARLFHGKIAAFFRNAGVEYPPYESALSAGGDIDTEFMRKAGYY